MAERVCSPDDNANSAAQAGGHGKLYGPAFVEILEVDPGANTVKFRTAASGGKPPVEVKCQWTRQNVWAQCPSDLNSDEMQLPTPGSSGTLYLSQALVDANQLPVNVKWPDALAIPPEYRPMDIWPTSVVVHGFELATGTMTSGTIDLMDPDVAAPHQTVTLSNKPMKLKLSQRGFFRFLAPWPSISDLEEAASIINARSSVSSARDKARAWAQIAAWEEALRAPAHVDEGGLAAARRLLETLDR